jgi:hypothetical protein
LLRGVVEVVALLPAIIALVVAERVGSELELL